MPRDFNVGDQVVLRGGIVIGCVEVYYEGRRKTGKWIEIDALAPTDPSSRPSWGFGQKPMPRPSERETGDADGS